MAAKGGSVSLYFKEIRQEKLSSSSLLYAVQFLRFLWLFVLKIVLLDRILIEFRSDTYITIFSGVVTKRMFSFLSLILL